MRRLTRRSFLGIITGATAGVAVSIKANLSTCNDSDPNDDVSNGQNCNVEIELGPTDSDSGRQADPISGRECRLTDGDSVDKYRRCSETGFTDADSGSTEDAAGHGMGSGFSDDDMGPRSDLAGNGRHGGSSDNDPTDPEGCGRNCGGGNRSGFTDSDTGGQSDPALNGRGTGCTDNDPNDSVENGQRCVSQPTDE
ncbi:MAG: hypothetical protein HWD83_03330 [Gammaproteobacteria bacterium]|nr:hypothetical protein [Gammaproteobacteria bacterium]